MSDAPFASSSQALKQLKYDLPAGLVVFLVAIPLCLGIALASGAPLISGVLAGIVGGLVVPLLSRSPLSVAGPAAGLTAILVQGIDQLGGFALLLPAIMLGGLVQLLLSLFRAGAIARWFPVAVIEGMLAAIGLILIHKQIPYLLGLPLEYGLDALWKSLAGSDWSWLDEVQWGAPAISIPSLLILIFWDRTSIRALQSIPSALVVVVMGAVIHTWTFALIDHALTLPPAHLVQMPEVDLSQWQVALIQPDHAAWRQPAVYWIGLTIGLVASLETLLSVEAVDQLDPWKRRSPLNRELMAQGVANITAGWLGALPVTSVIVRSSTNIEAGGRTRASAFVHGLLMLGALLFLTSMLNHIPLAALAAILVLVGYKLARPSIFQSFWKRGHRQSLPFVTTVVFVLLTNLLLGIVLGWVLAALLAGFRKPAMELYFDDALNAYRFHISGPLTFLGKARFKKQWLALPQGVPVVATAGPSAFLDYDLQLAIDDCFKHASDRGIHLSLDPHTSWDRLLKDVRSPIPLASQHVD